VAYAERTSTGVINGLLAASWRNNLRSYRRTGRICPILEGMENMVAPGDKVTLHGEVVEIAQETAIITLAGGMADLVAVPVQYLEKEAE
jgi:hypothetical protein